MKPNDKTSLWFWEWRNASLCAITDAKKTAYDARTEAETIEGHYWRNKLNYSWQHTSEQ